MEPVRHLTLLVALISFRICKANFDPAKHGWEDPFAVIGEDSDASNPLALNALDPEWKDNFDIGMHEPSNVVPAKPGWKDPFAVIGEESDSPQLLVLSDVEKRVLEKRLKDCNIFTKRFTNVFLAAIMKSQDFKNSGSSLLKIIDLELSITTEQLKTLNNYGKNWEDENVEKVATTLSDIFLNSRTSTKSKLPSLADVLKWIQSKLMKLLKSPEWTVASSIFMLLFLTLWFAKNHSYRFALFSLFFTIFLCGFGFTWIRMIEEKEVERFAKMEQHGNVPYHCGKNDMQWYQHMFYRMFGEDCVKFYQIRDIRPVVLVSPTVALSETISSMIVEPSKNIGIAYGSFISSITGAVPWYLKGIAIIIGSLLPIVFLMVLLTFLFGYNLSLSLAGFHIYPSCLNSSIPAPSRNEEKYVEDMSRKEPERKSSYEELMNNSTEPVFVMNWKGMQKLVSNTTIKEEEEEDTKEKPKENVGRSKENLAPIRTQDNLDVKMIGPIADVTDSEESCRKRSVNVNITNDKQLPIDTENSNQGDSADQYASGELKTSLDAVSKQETKDKRT